MDGREPESPYSFWISFDVEISDYDGRGTGYVAAFPDGTVTYFLGREGSGGEGWSSHDREEIEEWYREIDGAMAEVEGGSEGETVYGVSLHEGPLEWYAELPGTVERIFEEMMEHIGSG